MSVSSRRGGVYGRDTLAFPGPVVPMRSRNRAESARRAKHNKIVYAPDAPEAKPERAPPSARARVGAAATGADERAGRTACGDGRSGSRCQNRGAERRRPDAADAGIRRLKKAERAFGLEASVVCTGGRGFARGATVAFGSASADPARRVSRRARADAGTRRARDPARPRPGSTRGVEPRGLLGCDLERAYRHRGATRRGERVGHGALLARSSGAVSP